MIYSFNLGGIPFSLNLDIDPATDQVTVKLVDEGFNRLFFFSSSDDISKLVNLLFNKVGQGFNLNEVTAKKLELTHWANLIVKEYRYQGSSKKLQQFEKDGISTL